MLFEFEPTVTRKGNDKTLVVSPAELTQLKILMVKTLYPCNSTAFENFIAQMDPRRGCRTVDNRISITCTDVWSIAALGTSDLAPLLLLQDFYTQWTPTSVERLACKFFRVHMRLLEGDLEGWDTSIRSLFTELYDMICKSARVGIVFNVKEDIDA